MYHESKRDPNEFSRKFRERYFCTRPHPELALQMILKKAALVVFGVLVVALAGELFLRATGFGQVTPKMSFGSNAATALDRGYMVPDQTLFWKGNPDRIPHLRPVGHFVHPDAPITPRGTRKRLIVLGDSCSRLVQGGLPYSAPLEAELGSKDWEVLNASLPGYSSYQGLLWLRSQLLAADPDVVVIYFGWNDHWRTTGQTDREYEQTIRPGRLRLFNLLNRRPDPPPFRVPLAEYRENLQTMIDDVLRGGGRVVLIAAPYRFPEENKKRYVANASLLPSDDVVSLHQSYRDVVREFIGKDNVSVLAADLVFAELGKTPALLRDDGIHLTNEGHRVMGALLAEQIRSGSGRDGTAAPALLDAARRTRVQETRPDGPGRSVSGEPLGATSGKGPHTAETRLLN